MLDVSLRTYRVESTCLLSGVNRRAESPDDVGVYHSSDGFLGQKQTEDEAPNRDRLRAHPVPTKPTGAHILNDCHALHVPPQGFVHLIR